MKKLSILILLLSGLYSCQEVITVNLSSVTPKVVVDGSITNRPGPYSIKLSTTTNYFSPSGSNPLSGARVVISDNAGNTDTLHESAPGNYVTKTLNGTPGRTYYLGITASGKQYTAYSSMPDTVGMDSLSYALRPSRPGSTQAASYSLTCSFTDPATLGNYYGFRLYRNGMLKDDVIDNRVISDKLINGNAQHYRIRDGDLLAGDSVRIDLISFDKSAYDYFNTLRQTLSAGGPFSAPPANPASNVTNGGAGYFGAFAITSKAVQLQ
ncbi:MAG TPA: DUF4249 domain-containing protein [Bacteroidia bacterium]|jgi:hypothetical protein|nr:DUF4249 domain-containing protein [Bacteroidia bacterium]